MFDRLPKWVSTIGDISGADPEPTPPGDTPPAVMSQADIAALLGDIMSQAQAAKTDDEKAKLAKDLKDAQDIIAANEAANQSAAQREASEAKRELRTALAEAEAGKQAAAYATRIGTMYAIERLTAKDDQGVEHVKYQWQDVDTVYALLDHSKITFDFSTGKVSGLEAQLDKLAAEKGFLLKPADNPSGGPVYTPPVGTPPAGGNSGDRSDSPRNLSQYANMSAYKNSLGRLPGAQPVFVPSVVLNGAQQ